MPVLYARLFAFLSLIFVRFTTDTGVRVRVYAAILLYFPTYTQFFTFACSLVRVIGAAWKVASTRSNTASEMTK